LQGVTSKFRKSFISAVGRFKRPLSVSAVDPNIYTSKLTFISTFLHVLIFGGFTLGKEESWVTIVLSDEDAVDALILAKSIKRTLSTKLLTVLYGEHISVELR